MLVAFLCPVAITGCSTPAGGSARGLFAPASRPAPTVLYPSHPAPGRVVALRPLTGISVPAGAPGQIRRILTGETSESSRDSQLIRPLSLAVRGGQILVVDMGRGAIVQIDLASGRMQLLELRGTNGPVQPVAIVSDDRGSVYVADAKAGAVLQVRPDNSVVRSLRPAAGERFVPVDLAVGADRLYAVNRAGRRVEVFDLSSGQHMGPFANGEQGRARFPVAVSVDGEGRVYVVDMVGSRVRVFTPAGEPVRQFGAPGDRPGLFAQPRSVAVGPDGIAYVSDVATQVVQMFNASNELLMYFGGAGDGPGDMGMPSKIVVDRTLLGVFASQMPKGFEAQYMILVANQVGPGRIGVYAFGQLPQAVEGGSQP